MADLKASPRHKLLVRVAGEGWIWAAGWDALCEETVGSSVVAQGPTVVFSQRWQGLSVPVRFAKGGRLLGWRRGCLTRTHNAWIAYERLRSVKTGAFLTPNEVPECTQEQVWAAPLYFSTVRKKIYQKPKGKRSKIINLTWELLYLSKCLTQMSNGFPGAKSPHQKWISCKELHHNRGQWSCCAGINNRYDFLDLPLEWITSTKMASVKSSRTRLS